VTAPITRAEAIAQGLTRYFTGAPCKHGHVTFRNTANHICVECQRQRSLAHYHGPGHEERVEQMRAYKDANREKVRASSQDWKVRNIERSREINRKHFQENREYHRERGREYKKRFRAEATAHQMRRKASQISATPPWLSAEQESDIRDFYREAARLSRGGARYHVDHIFPLKGSNFSGLHVPWNLRVLEAAKNIAKSNRFPEEFREWAW
jgi:hypothetical protein